MATHCRILAWRILWAEEPGKLWSLRLQRVRYDWNDNTLYFPSSIFVKASDSNSHVYFFPCILNSCCITIYCFHNDFTVINSRYYNKFNINICFNIYYTLTGIYMFFSLLNTMLKLFLLKFLMFFSLVYFLKSKIMKLMYMDTLPEHSNCQTIL